MTSIDVDLVFEDPSPRSGKRGAKSFWNPYVAAARDNAGRWIKVPSPNQSAKAAAAASKTIKRGLLVSTRPDGSFESASRKGVEDGVYYVYLRFVGEF